MAKKVTHISSDRSQRILTVRFSGLNIRTTVARRPSAVRRWVHVTRSRHRQCCNNTPLIVGLGVQWRPKLNRSDPDPIPSTLQLSVGHRCLIIQLSRSRPFPLALTRLLEDRDVTFASVNVVNDCRMLREGWGLRVENAREIRLLAEQRMGRGNASMSAMAGEILGFAVREVESAKSEEVGRSRWDVLELSHRQIKYAAVDAYVSLRLGLRLIRGS